MLKSRFHWKSYARSLARECVSFALAATPPRVRELTIIVKNRIVRTALPKRQNSNQCQITEAFHLWRTHSVNSNDNNNNNDNNNDMNYNRAGKATEISMWRTAVSHEQCCELITSDEIEREFTTKVCGAAHFGFSAFECSMWPGLCGTDKSQKKKTFHFLSPYTSDVNKRPNEIEILSVW